MNPRTIQPDRLRNARGFTLGEVVLVVILVGIIAATFGPGLVTAMRATVMTDTRKEALQNAHAALDRMAREIRMIRSATVLDIPIISFPTGNDMEFVDTYGNTIRFRLVGANLERNGAVLAGNVTALTFSYLQNSGAAAGNVTQIWRIVIDLTVQVGAESVPLRTEVHPTGF